jgi:hypothetical protein
MDLAALAIAFAVPVIAVMLPAIAERREAIACSDDPTLRAGRST